VHDKSRFISFLPSSSEAIYFSLSHSLTLFSLFNLSLSHTHTHIKLYCKQYIVLWQAKVRIFQIVVPRSQKPEMTVIDPLLRANIRFKEKKQVYDSWHSNKAFSNIFNEPYFTLSTSKNLALKLKSKFCWFSEQSGKTDSVRTMKPTNHGRGNHIKWTLSQKKTQLVLNSLTVNNFNSDRNNTAV